MTMTMKTNTLPTILLSLSLLALARAAADSAGCPSDPYADPRHDDCNPLKYIPSLPLNALACGLFALIGCVFVFWHFRSRANWVMVLTIGSFTEAIGFAMRIYFRQVPHNITIYAVANAFIVLSPCCFLAADYLILKHLVNYLQGERYIRPFKTRWLARAFVCSDVFTFLIQASGGGMAASSSNANLGQKLFLIGLILQLASFAFFTVLFIVFGFRLRNNDSALWEVRGWKPFYAAVGFTCICFLIRSLYRVVELSQGFEGYLATHEATFLLLDSLPLFIGICTYAIFWPGKYIPHGELLAHTYMPSSISPSATPGVGVVPAYEMNSRKDYS